ncbi:hypothetical protein ACCO45_001873 [Purpureocillium lilacinum]|uniref:Uncharacterized protein n=1 Tax=Purpureocillium lilacinum TaxID=33203 RepID=A0ACC4E9N8_PURLI
MYIMHRICGSSVETNTDLTRADKFIPVNPAKTFHIPEDEVDKFPSGYRYLAWAEVRIGHPPKLNLNSHGPETDILYRKCKDWLEGRAVVPDLTGEDWPDWKP